MVKNHKNKSKAQTMVEFALVLPILMLVVFGLLEVGRMVFVYVTIASASREAVRYGSATGVSSTSNSTNKFADCAGIRAAAQNVDFLNSFTDSDIVIQYFHAGSSTPFSSCPVGGIGPAVITNGDKIFVRVRGNFEPIVRLIPLLTRTIANGNPITSQNFHTLIGSADIPIQWFNPGSSSDGGEEPCFNCFEPNTLLCNNYGENEFPNSGSTLPDGWFKDWLGNCYEDPLNNDYCLNLPGKQRSMPLGYYYDEATPIPPATPSPPDRICVALNSGDVCPNLEGIQATDVLYDPESIDPDYDPIIAIYTLDNSGYCVIDYCRNMDGIQYALPSSQWYDTVLDVNAITNRFCTNKPSCTSLPGTVFDYTCYKDGVGGLPEDGDFTCCVAVTDYCTNIAGPQNKIPDGYYRDDNNGTCYAIPVCRYSSSGDVPMKIVEGSTENDPTIWYIKNETNNPIKITDILINWDDTDSKLFLKSLFFGALKINNINASVSGYEPLTLGESIQINGGDTLQVGLTYSYDKPAPNEINVETIIRVILGTDRCYFGPDPDGVLPDQPYCLNGTNYLYSDCVAQSK